VTAVKTAEQTRISSEAKNSAIKDRPREKKDLSSYARPLFKPTKRGRIDRAVKKIGGGGRARAGQKDDETARDQDKTLKSASGPESGD